jgi:hypothetical protein
MREIVVNDGKPKTFYIKFFEPLPRKFCLFRNGELYFERFLNGLTPRIKFNIPNPGIYVSKNNFEILKCVDIEIPKVIHDLPEAERSRIKNFVIVDNPSLEDTPARVFTDRGIIEKGKSFNSYPKPMRVFFLLHEVGHFYYETEKYCDLFALTHFLQMGYNMSTAIYCLTNVLKRNKQNLERTLFIYKKVIKSNGIQREK